MKSILLLIILFTTIQSSGQRSYELLSPDKKIKTAIRTDKQLTYSLYVDDKKIISDAIIDMMVQEMLPKQLSMQSPMLSLSKDLKTKSVKTRSVNETIVAQIPVNRKNIPDVYNELTIQLTNHFAVIFRAYNDGFTYRIVTSFTHSIIVYNETAAFNFTSKACAWVPLIQKREGVDIYHTSFEDLYPYKALDSLSVNDLMYSPVLVNTTDNIKVAITESDLDDYPGMFLKGNSSNSLQSAFAPYPLEERIVEGDYPAMVVNKRADYIAATNGIRAFPWRVLMIARADKDLPANDLVYRLAPPSTIEDASWIQPGKCTDEWIIDVNLFNVPFKSGVNTASYKYYIDFAKRFGFDRIMMDAGWSNTKDLFDINPNINMDTIATYAKQQGIRLSMWTLSMTLNKQLDSALKQFQQWGVDFIMTDFIDRDDQPVVNFHKRIAEACAKAKIMIMFHGSYPPKGFNRTYPNCITKEAVLGSEYNAWSDKPTAAHNCIIPFTRMLAGPLDYEPGILDNATPKQFKPIWGKVMSQTTRCQQLALFMVYDSPLQIFAGNPSQGYMEAKFMELLGSIPTSWDTTIILDAKVGAYIITARRKGNDWFIGGITDSTARDINIDLSFLREGNYVATICRDGINAERNAMDYVIEETSVNRAGNYNMHLAPNGGFLMRVRKE